MEDTWKRLGHMRECVWCCVEAKDSFRFRCISRVSELWAREREDATPPTFSIGPSSLGCSEGFAFFHISYPSLVVFEERGYLFSSSRVPGEREQGRAGPLEAEESLEGGDKEFR
jgi:hypothetical protein